VLADVVLEHHAVLRYDVTLKIRHARDPTFGAEHRAPHGLASSMRRRASARSSAAESRRAASRASASSRSFGASVRVGARVLERAVRDASRASAVRSAFSSGPEHVRGNPGAQVHTARHDLIEQHAGARSLVCRQRAPASPCSSCHSTMRST
jgi:hypothetical protein